MKDSRPKEQRNDYFLSSVFSCLLLLRLLTFLLVRFKLVDVRARLISLAVRSTLTFHWAVRQSVPPSLRPSVRPSGRPSLKNCLLFLLCFRWELVLYRSVA